METPIQLASLNCIKCSTNLPARPNEIGWVCEQCGQAQRLFENDSLIEMRLHYSDSMAEGKAGRPFWVASGLVEMDRQTYNALFGKKADEAQKFWMAPRNFFIPAFTCGLEKMIDMATTLVRQQPRLVEGRSVSFAPITVRIEDVQNLIEFVVMGIEAERSDNIKQINFSVNVGQPDLWILP